MNGKVKISAGYKLKSAGTHKIYDCACSIDKIQYAYLVINAHLEPYLFLFTTPAKQNFISTSYEGFEKVYKKLSEMYGFNDDMFFKYLHKQEPLKACIWRKIEDPTYHILGEKFTDYKEGFEIQSPQKEFISWDMPLGVLSKKKSAKLKFNFFGSKYLRFKYPVRIGSLVLENLQAIIHENRKDVPVLSFHAQCYDATNTDASYWELATYFTGEAKMPAEIGYDRSDQKYKPFDMEGMLLSICYTYDSENHFDGGYTSFRIENNRDYPVVLGNEEYEDKMEISQFQLLQKDIHIAGDYKKNKRIKRRPSKITALCGDQPVIWKDEQNKKIGFSGHNSAHIFDEKEIKSISIRNVLPAKGGGWADLVLHLAKQQYNYTVFSGACRSFDQYAAEIAKLTGKATGFLPESMDC